MVAMATRPPGRRSRGASQTQITTVMLASMSTSWRGTNSSAGLAKVASFLPGIGIQTRYFCRRHNQVREGPARGRHARSCRCGSRATRRREYPADAALWSLQMMEPWRKAPAQGRSQIASFDNLVGAGEASRVHQSMCAPAIVDPQHITEQLTTISAMRSAALPSRAALGRPCDVPR